MKRCTQQTHIIKKQGADLKQQKESTAHANEEVSRLTADMWVLKSRFQTVEHKLTSWDKKHIKYRNERDTLSTEKAKIEEELVGTKSQLEHRNGPGGTVIVSWSRTNIMDAVSINTGAYNARQPIDLHIQIASIAASAFLHLQLCIKLS
ncbi:hypothetical protein Tco_0478322 [Tanacetum coccineum]